MDDYWNTPLWEQARDGEKGGSGALPDATELLMNPEVLKAKVDALLPTLRAVLNDLQTRGKS